MKIFLKLIENFVWNCNVFYVVGWLDFTACQPIGLFYAENVFIIFIWYNFYAYSYLNAVNKYQRYQNKTMCFMWFNYQEYRIFLIVYILYSLIAFIVLQLLQLKKVFIESIKRAPYMVQARLQNHCKLIQFPLGAS